ncbi:hypothetical protein CDD83_4340 [Cordyceps sp. RAO-2017]|nr:hypothetical protein CDD83_4340 [Cordyceps sp. RAO-2017]
MPRPRKSLAGPHPQPESRFNVRWHSVANPATPSADIMSSPDPLNEATSTLPPPPPSTLRRVTRSQRSQRFASLTSSPRKQMFELQVGDTRSPQRLWVTVETDDADDAGRDPRRKLFQSPASSARRRGARAVTTVVPLRDSVDDEGEAALATPRRRRARKSNGTPMPGAAKRKAAAPPPSAEKRTPRRRRLLQADDAGLPPSEASSTQPTPRSTRRGRPPKKRAAPEPPSETGPDAARRTKRRKPTPVLEEPTDPPVPSIEIQSPSASDVPALNDDTTGAAGPREPRLPPTISTDDPATADNDQDFDIWMATLTAF